MPAYRKLQRNKNHIQTISSIMKQKKILKGFIPEDVLEEVHSAENFISINLRTDIRMIRDNLKREKEHKKGKK